MLLMNAQQLLTIIEYLLMKIKRKLHPPFLA
jgi:hypothetical protein